MPRVQSQIELELTQLQQLLDDILTIFELDIRNAHRQKDLPAYAISVRQYIEKAIKKIDIIYKNLLQIESIINASYITLDSSLPLNHVADSPPPEHPANPPSSYESIMGPSSREQAKLKSPHEAIDMPSIVNPSPPSSQPLSPLIQMIRTELSFILEGFNKLEPPIKEKRTTQGKSNEDIFLEQLILRVQRLCDDINLKKITNTADKPPPHKTTMFLLVPQFISAIEARTLPILHDILSASDEEFNIIWRQLDEDLFKLMAYLCGIQSVAIPVTKIDDHRIVINDKKKNQCVLFDFLNFRKDQPYSSYSSYTLPNLTPIFIELINARDVNVQPIVETQPTDKIQASVNSLFKTFDQKQCEENPWNKMLTAEQRIELKGWCQLDVHYETLDLLDICKHWLILYDTDKIATINRDHQCYSIGLAILIKAACKQLDIQPTTSPYSSRMKWSPNHPSQDLPSPTPATALTSSMHCRQ